MLVPCPRRALARAARSFRLALFACLASFAVAATPALAQQADLVVNQADSPDPGPAGGTFTYTIRIDNNGPNAALGVNFSDTLPPGSTFVDATTTQGSCSAPVAGVLACALGDLAFLANATVTVRVVLPTAGVWTNTASATSATTDPNGTNNLNVVENTTAQLAADMTLAIAPVGTVAAAGANYSYVVTAKNNGPTGLAATDTETIAFTIPAGACVRSVPTGTGWSCAPASGYPLCAGTITCTRTGALASGASAPALTVPAVANVGGAITAAFQVSSSLADGNPANNTVTSTVTVTGGSSDVSITKTAAPATVAIGSNVTYTLTPRYKGGEPPGSAAPNVITVTDTLGAGLAFVSAAGTGWTCTFASPVVTCTLPGPYTGAPFTNMAPINIVATVTSAGTVGNTATIAIPETDPFPSDNTASVNVTGSNTADLSLTKAASQNPVVPGFNFSYTLTVRNNGPVPVGAGQTITVTDSLPAGLTLRAAPSGGGFACTTVPSTAFPIAAPVTITCTRTGALASGSTAAITVPVVATVAGTLVNNACASLAGAGPADPAAGNNCSSVSLIATDSTVAADLQLVSKTAGPNPVNAGADLTYTITVANAGPGVATNVTVTDTLASLVTTGGFQSATPSQGTCTPSGVTNGPSVSLSCNVGTLAVGATATVTVVVRPSIATTGPRTNNAVVTSPDIGDPNRINNTLPAAISSVVTAVADVTVTKTDTPDPVQAGTPLTYVITARNNGPSTAQNVVVTDTLPANAAFVSLAATTGSPTCSTPAVNATGGTLTCTWASLASGVQQTVTVIVRPATGAATVHNDVVVSTTTLESNTANNSAFADTAVTAAAIDLIVNKVDSVDPVALGALTRYTITVSNGGPSFATNVQMVDTFPLGGTPTATFSYQGNLAVAPPGSGTCVEPAVGTTAGTLTCSFPGLANKASVVVSYDMRAEAISTSVSGTSFNTATVSAAEPESPAAQANNTATNSTTSRQPIDLALTKTGPAAIVPGSPLAWTIVVTNNGPNPTTGAQVTDTLPAGVTFQSASPGCAFAGGTVTCAVGALAVGATVTLTINVDVPGNYAGANPIVNTAMVNAVNEVDTNPANNTATASTSVTPQADLAVTKTVSNATPAVGSGVTFTITVTNQGPNGAAAVQVTDALPTGYAFLSANPSVGTYNPGTGVWSGIGTLANGASATLTINVTVLAAGPYLNTATATTTTLDPVPANNTATAGTAPTAQADLAVAKTVSNGTPNVGATVTFTVTVTNHGPSSATGVQVTDVLPAGYAFVAAAPGVGSYDAGTGLWSGIGTLANGASATLTVTATVNAAGPYVNTAVGTSTSTDPNPGNNSASAATAPVAVAHLALAKTDNSATYTPGGTGTYVVTVTNSGPSAASAVTVADTLPAGVTLSGAVTCTPTGTANCGTVAGSTGQGSFGATGATIAAGSGNALIFTVPVAYASAMTTDPLVNTATASDPASPPAAGSDSSARAASVALVVAKTDGSANYTPGGTATYVVTVTNTGPSDAANVTVTDLLPVGLTLTANVTCTANGAAACGTVTGANGQASFGTTGATLGAGPGDTLVFTVPVAFAAGMTTSPLVNTATATDVATGATASGADADAYAAQVTLAVVKTDGSATYTPGGTASYTVTVTNGGISTATSVAVSDALPAGVTLTGAVTCAASGASSCGTVTGSAGQTAFGATNAVVVPGAGNAIVFTVPVAFAAGLAADPLVNTATATDGPSGASGSGADSDARAPRVSLVVTKTDNSTTYTPGGTATYTVTVANTGASDALDVTVNDTLPAGVTLTAAATCTANGIALCGAVTGTTGQASFGATGAAIAAGPGNVLVFTLPVAFASGLADDPLINTATASDRASGATGSASDSDRIAPRVSLAVTKTDNSATYVPGGAATYAISVRNTGVSDATDVTVSDPLPAGVVLSGSATCTAIGLASCGAVQGSAGQTSFGVTGARVNAGLGELQIAAPVTFAPGLAADPLVNTVTVTDVASGASGSATDSDARATAGVTLAKSILPETIVAGDNATLTIALGNPNGSATALTAAFVDPMPPGVTTASANLGTCAGVAVAASRITMAAGTPVPAGGCTIVVTITSSTEGTVVNTTGSLQTSAGSAPPASAPLTVAAPVGPGVPVAPTLAKTIAPATIAAGGTATLTLTLGSANATTLTAPFIDAMPAGVTTTSANTGTCAGVTVTATQITMASGTTLPAGGCTIVVTITSSTPGTVVNTTGALQTAAGVAPAASAPLTVTTSPGGTPSADLAITKTDNVATVAPGGTVTYVIVVTNHGPAAVAGATVTDVLPAVLTGATWTCTASAGGNCPAAGTGSINALVSLPAGGTATFTVTATLAASAAGTLSNTAAVAPPAGVVDPDAGNNAATDTDTVVATSVDLAIAKVHVGGFAPGQTGAQYTITVSNVGTAVSSGPVTVTDALPAGLVATAIGGTGWTCTQPAGPCGRSDPLPPGASYPVLTLTVNVAANAPSPLVNTASVAGGGDANGANNAAQDAVTFAPPPPLPGPEPIPVDSRTLLVLLAGLLACAGARRLRTRRTR